MAIDDVEKRRAYRRKKARKKHLKAFFVLFIFFALAIGIILSLTVLFPIKYVNATGSSLYERVHIENKSDLIGKNIFTFSSEELENKLRKKFPFIDSIEVSRRLPDTVNIKVKDAKEFACYQVDSSYFTVSKSGYVLEKYKKEPDDLLLIKASKVDCNIGSAVKFEKEETKLLIENIISEINKNEISVTQIDITDKNNITLNAENRFKVLLGSNSFIENKFAHLNGMIKNISESESGTINLSMWTNEKSEGTFVKDTKK